MAPREKTKMAGLFIKGVSSMWTAPKRTSQTQMTKAHRFLEKYRSEKTNSEQQTYQIEMAQLSEENARLKEENCHLKDLLVKEIPGVLSAMKQSVRTYSPTSSSEVSFQSSSSPRPQPSSHSPVPQMSRESSDEAFSEMVEIYSGTQVFCDKLSWAAAVNASSVSVFVRTLVMSVFPVDVLLKSNLRGQIREGKQSKEPLDNKKIDAIFRATLKKWPNTTPSQIGSAINAKLNELRSKKRREDKEKEGTLMLFND
ncbi:hypothetical protein SKAU_G00280690 [Synaphobranchus kaupii]|uniref:BEN domain-containing protein n=1 Tax=Synaphobranchus kaupii TaxID=118154 RepID=A0A9Q1EWZ5_SYNKA|nr:hypothetical protein SKAU_G00280690 [Synaphobranchus kaupii]